MFHRIDEDNLEELNAILKRDIAQYLMVPGVLREINDISLTAQRCLQDMGASAIIQAIQNNYLVQIDVNIEGKNELTSFLKQPEP